MKILVTGGTGKVGVEVVKELQKRRVEIRLLVRKELTKRGANVIVALTERLATTRAKELTA